MGPKTPFSASFNRLLIDLLQLDEPPSFITEAVLHPAGKEVHHINWAAALQTFHYRRTGANGVVLDEAPFNWGHCLFLQLMLAVGIEDLAPHFAKQIEAFSPYLLGPPHKTERDEWEKAKPLPPRYERRFTALRRAAWLWLRRDPTLLPLLVTRYESKIDRAVWRSGKTLADQPGTTTAIDLIELKSFAQDMRRVSPAPGALPVLRTTEQDEFAAFDRLERFGVTTRFADSAKLYRNYVFVKLSTYVRAIWDLQENTPALPFGDVNTGEAISDATLQVGVNKAAAWLGATLSVAGSAAHEKVLAALGLDRSTDHVVYYRNKAGVKPKTGRRTRYKSTLYTVKTPPEFPALKSELRVRLSKGGIYVLPADLGTTIADLREAYLKTGTDTEARERVFDNGYAHARDLEFVRTDIVLATLHEPLLRAWFADTFQGDAASWRVKYETALRAARRASGVRTRLKVPFTPAEDLFILQAGGTYMRKVDLDMLSARFPHHSARRVSERVKLLLLLASRGVEVGTTPITKELALQVAGKFNITKYSNGV